MRRKRPELKSYSFQSQHAIEFFNQINIFSLSTDKIYCFFLLTIRWYHVGTHECSFSSKTPLSLNFSRAISSHLFRGVHRCKWCGNPLTHTHKHVRERENSLSLFFYLGNRAFLINQQLQNTYKFLKNKTCTLNYGNDVFFWLKKNNLDFFLFLL